jgi:hypothetical protein
LKDGRVGRIQPNIGDEGEKAEFVSVHDDKLARLDVFNGAIVRQFHLQALCEAAPRDDAQEPTHFPHPPKFCGVSMA